MAFSVMARKRCGIALCILEIYLLVLATADGEEVLFGGINEPQFPSGNALVLEDPPVPDCNDKHSSRYDPLACWLKKLKLSIPDQSFKKAFLEVHVRNLVCTDFTVAGLDSAYIPSQQNLYPSIDLAIKGISASCNGGYKVSPGDIRGDLHTKAISVGSNAYSEDGGENTAIDLTLEVISSDETNSDHYLTNYSMPIALNTSKCQPSLQVTDLEFTGSISAKIINLFSGMIQDEVSNQLNKQLCPQVKKAVDPVVTKALKIIDKEITKYLPQNSTLQQRINEINQVSQTRRIESIIAKEKPLDFQNDTPLLIKSLHAINSFLRCYYSSSTIMDSTENNNCRGLVTEGFKAILSLVLDDLAEEVNIPLPNLAHKIHFGLPNYGKVRLNIKDVHVRGLDQLDGLSLLSPVIKSTDPISNFVSQIQSAKGLNITADLNVTVLSIPGGMFQGDPLYEIFHVNLNFSSLSALGNLALAFKRDQFQQVQVGTLLDILPFYHKHHHYSANRSAEKKCIVEGIETLSIAGLAIHTIVEGATVVPDFSSGSTMVSKQLEEDLDGLLNRILQLVLQEYGPTLTAAIAGLVQKPLATFLNGWIHKKLGRDDFSVDFPGTVEGPQSIPPGSFLARRGDERCNSGDDDVDWNHHALANFSTVGLLHEVNRYLNKPSTLKSINRALERFAARADKLESSKLLSPDWLPQSGWHFKNEIPGMSIRLQELLIENLGTLHHIDVLFPEMDGLRLKNGFSLGLNNASMPKIHASLGVKYYPRNLSGILNATISFSDIHLDGSSLLRLDMTRLRQLTWSQLFSNRHCALAPFQEHVIYNDCNVSGVGSFLGNASATFTGQAGFDNFTVFMDTEEYPSAASLVTSLFAWITNTIRQSINSGSHSTLEQAEGYCTGGRTFGYDDDPPVLDDGYEDHWLFPVLYIFLGVYAVAQSVILFIRRPPAIQSAGGTPVFDSVSNSVEPLLHFDEEHNHGRSLEGKDGVVCNSLVHTSAISAFARHFVPIFIIGTIVLLFSSNTSSGATVDLYVSYGESQEISFPSLFTFSLLNTAKDMWRAKIYPLFFLVLIMSGVWPYVKLIMMLLAWIVPTTTLSSPTRERLLLALDALGKFALVDTYLFVLMMVAFRYHLSLSEKVSVDAFVSPQTGFYTFLVATCFSLLVGHVLVFFHRKSEMKHLTSRPDARIADHRESVLEHHFFVQSRGHESSEQRVRFSRCFQNLLLAAISLTAFLLCIGVTRESFKFEFGGIAGDVLGEDRISYYSLLSLGWSLRSSVKYPSKGIVLLEVAYYFYAVVTPITCLGLLTFLLLCPMTLSAQRFILSLAEITNAWSAIEVFVLSIIASLLEISTFASFIIGDKCDLIDRILRDYFSSAMANESDATCFTVTSTVQSDSWFLISGVVMNSFIVSLVLRFIHCSMSERIKAEMEGIPAHPFDEDALASNINRRQPTIADLFARGFWKDLVFDDHGQVNTNDGYVPQSVDTLSVAPSVNWDESMTHDGEEHRTPGSMREPRPDISTADGVKATLRNAFQGD